MRAAWQIIQKKYPSIYAQGCAGHGVNLLIKDIVSVGDNDKTKKSAEKIIKFVKNHHLVKSMYENRRALAKVPQTLSMPVVSRWYSRYNAMNSLLSSKYVLIQLFDDEENILKSINPKITSLQIANLIKSHDFWNKLTKLVKCLEFPSNVIGKAFSQFIWKSSNFFLYRQT